MISIQPSSALRSESGKIRRVAVIGGGVAGLMTVVELVRARVPVDLFSLLPVRRSPSVSSQGGFNAAIDPFGGGDSPERHFEETIRVGECLAHQPPVRAMTEAAPGLVSLFDRMGVPFHRTGEGRPLTRRLSGSTLSRAAFAGATTGQQILYALDEQVRRYEVEPCIDARGVSIPGESMVRKLEHWELVRFVRDESGVCTGIVAQDLRSMAIKAMPYDAVVLATGGYASLFGGAATSPSSIGSAASIAYQQGAAFANPELVGFHPTAIHGFGRPKSISDAARSEGGRLWIPRDPNDTRAPRDISERERDYFLERLYPEWGNLVAADVAARAIHRLCVHEGVGVPRSSSTADDRAVYLDLTHVTSSEAVADRLRGVTELCARFGKVDLRTSPVKVSPAATHSLGGLWVDFEADASGSIVHGSPRNHATTVPGLYAVGEVEYQYHGAQRLSGNGLLACTFGATLCGPAVAAYRQAMARSAYDLPRSLFDKAEKAQSEAYAAILTANQGDDSAENAYVVFDDLGALMSAHVGIERDAKGLEKAAEALDEIEARCEKVKVTDASTRSNQAGPFVRQLHNAITLARLVVAGAGRRSESRGAHHHASHAQRDDARWLRSTIAFAEQGAEPRFVDEVEYECVGKAVRVGAAVDVRFVAAAAREVAKPFAPARAVGPTKDSKAAKAKPSVDEGEPS